MDFEQMLQFFYVTNKVMQSAGIFYLWDQHNLYSIHRRQPFISLYMTSFRPWSTFCVGRYSVANVGHCSQLLSSLFFQVAEFTKAKSKLLRLLSFWIATVEHYHWLYRRPILTQLVPLIHMCTKNYIFSYVNVALIPQIVPAICLCAIASA